MYRYAVTHRMGGQNLPEPPRTCYLLEFNNLKEVREQVKKHGIRSPHTKHDIWRRRKDWEPWQHYKTVK